MSENATLLIEILTEELPPHQVQPLAEAFRDSLVQWLEDAQFSPGDARAYGTPRRLAVRIEQTARQQPDQAITHRGPKAAMATGPDGKPTPAAMGFARKFGIAPEALDRESTDQGEYLCHVEQRAGQSLSEALTQQLPAILDSLPQPKTMRWGDHEHAFLRPIQGLLALHGADVLPVQAFGFTASRETLGHRVHASHPVSIPHADEYVLAMSHGYVMVDIAERKAQIQESLLATAGALAATLREDENLLNEVTQLVEWPVVLTAQFDEAFLQLPEAVLVTSMAVHQRYFALEKHGKLDHHFLVVSNLESQNPDTVVTGNARVIRARLSDAVFFFEQDKKTSLASRLPHLERMLFQEKLGSLADKTHRIQGVARAIAPYFDADIAIVEEAALLCKCDLLTEMVGEFPELQGVMGMHYALAEGLDESLCVALKESYQPAFATDALPETPAGTVLSLADRLDTLVGTFGVNLRPTGTKDPFALRRAMLGVLKILLDSKKTIHITALLEAAVAQYSLPLADDTVPSLIHFANDRLRHLLQEKGYNTGTLDAVMSLPLDAPLDIAHRIEAVHAFSKLPEAPVLSALHKRIANILRKQSGSLSDNCEPSLFKEAAESQLFARFQELAPEAETLLAERNYQAYLQKMTGFKEPLDHFFEVVMVMDEDMALRNNRLALLAKLNLCLSHVADISYLNA